MSTTAKLLLLPFVALFITSCSNDNEPIPANQPDRTNSRTTDGSDRGVDMDREFDAPPIESYMDFCSQDLSADGEEIFYELTGHLEEDKIAVYAMTTQIPMLQFRKVKQLHKELLTLPKDQYEAAGYDEYPNTLDFMFSYKWFHIATEKHLNEKKGVMRVVADPNPYNVYRVIVVALQGDLYEEIWFVQGMNPNGVRPPKDEDTYFLTVYDGMF